MQTQYSGASKKNADYEHAGVAIAVHRRLIKTVEEVREMWKKCRHMEDRQGYKKQQMRTKYKRKPIQEAYLHTWAEERKF